MSQICIEDVCERLERVFCICLLVDLGVLVFAIAAIAGVSKPPVIMTERELELFGLRALKVLAGTALVTVVLRCVIAGSLVYGGYILSRYRAEDYRLPGLLGPGLLTVGLLLRLIVQSAVYTAVSASRTVHELASRLVVLRMLTLVHVLALVLELVGMCFIAYTIYKLGRELGRDGLKIGSVLLGLSVLLRIFIPALGLVLEITGWALCLIGVHRG